MEREFYEIESIADRSDFLAKAYSYQLFFNLARPNSYKENKTPWQIVREKEPDLSQLIAMIPPVFIEDLLEMKLENPLKRGHDVSSTPSSPRRAEGLPQQNHLAGYLEWPGG
jgi:hypothetical protein